MEIIGRGGARRLGDWEWAERRGGAAGVLLDLGCGDGSFARRFAIGHPDWLAVGVDADRDALSEAARASERRIERGGATNALWIAANIETLPPQLDGAADQLAIYFPWAGLLAMILGRPAEFAALASRLCAPIASLSLVLNAAETPQNEPLAPGPVRGALAEPLAEHGFEIERCDWLDPATAPPTTWAGRLLKRSRRAAIGLEARRPRQR